MKKYYVLLTFLFFIFALFACTAKEAAKETTPELRPSQKLMQARKASLAAMSDNLEAGKFDAVAKSADGLAAETAKAGEKHPNPLGKELTLAISLYAKEISAAAAKQDRDTVKAKLGQIRGKCGECHAKIRDKK
jgi:hypothetical protein